MYISGGENVRVRKATTNSRAEVEVDQGIVRYKVNDANSDSESEEEEYWFENAAPKRLPIQPAEPKRTQNRIFNKFEPQSPPRIAGIKPPRSSLTGKKEDKKQKELSRTASSSPRLPRKVIIPTEQLDFEDDDEDLVRDEPGENKTATENSEENEDHPPSVVEENFVANVLADMSDMVLNLTADATEAKEGVTMENTSGRKSSA